MVITERKTNSYEVFFLQTPTFFLQTPIYEIIFLDSFETYISVYQFTEP